MYCILSAQYKVARAIAKHLNQTGREFADVEADYVPEDGTVDGFVFIEAMDEDEEGALPDARHWKDAEALRDYLWNEPELGIGLCSITIEPYCDDCGYPRDYHAPWCERDSTRRIDVDDIQERIDLLEDARESIFQAVELIRQATDDTPLNSRVMAYLIPALEMAASANHSWLGNNPCNIDDLIRSLKEVDGE